MDMGKVKIAGGSYAPRCDLSELRVHYRRGEARLTAGRSAQLIRENRQRRASPAGPRNAALSVLPLACISALVGINDLISFLQPMIFFFFSCSLLLAGVEPLYCEGTQERDCTSKSRFLSRNQSQMTV